jgi:hypothetical protein
MAKKKAKKKNKAAKTKKKVAGKKTAKKKAAKKATASKAIAKNKSDKMNLSSAKKRTAKTGSVKKRPVERRVRGKAEIVDGVEIEVRGVGAKFAGQSGDLQGLSDIEEADSESVSELLEEGQSYEAEVVHGVESAKDADQGEVRTHEVPEDDVPEEYRERDLPG